MNVPFLPVNWMFLLMVMDVIGNIVDGTGRTDRAGYGAPWAGSSQWNPGEATAAASFLYIMWRGDRSPTQHQGTPTLPGPPCHHNRGPWFCWWVIILLCLYVSSYPLSLTTDWYSLSLFSLKVSSHLLNRKLNTLVSCTNMVYLQSCPLTFSQLTDEAKY